MTPTIPHIQSDADPALNQPPQVGPGAWRESKLIETHQKTQLYFMNVCVRLTLKLIREEGKKNKIFFLLTESQTEDSAATVRPDFEDLCVNTVCVCV